VIRVTADSNIYISALHFGGPPDKLLDLARAGVIELTISDDILAEVTRVLRDKFGWSRVALSMAQARIADFTVRVAPAQKLDAVREDPADNCILERVARTCFSRSAALLTDRAQVSRTHRRASPADPLASYRLNGARSKPALG
jgi:predicted nucleic acid-binding protein